MKFLLLFFSLFLFSCTNKISQKIENNTKSKIESKKMENQTALQKQIDDLKNSMLEYMKTGQPEYSTENVNNCVKILEDYVSEIEKTNSKDEAMKIVKSTVLKLNDLNNNAKSELIETGEREQIANIIISATHAKGYNSMDEDVTEQWREW